MPKKTTPPSNTIDWHQGFFSALQLLFKDDLNLLELRREITLHSRQLRIDALITKKPDAVIAKGIARVFRRINIFEYKGPMDYLSVASLYRALAYCWLYGSIHHESITDMSLSLVVSRYPREAYQHMKEVFGWTLREAGSGITVVEGERMGIQVIETRKLEGEEGLWLRELRPELEAEGIGRLLKELGRQEGGAAIQTYLEIIVKANAGSMEELLKMDKTVEDILIRSGLAAKWEARGKAEGEAHQLKQAIKLVRGGKSGEELVQLFEEKLKSLAEAGLEELSP